MPLLGVRCGAQFSHEGLRRDDSCEVPADPDERLFPCNYVGRGTPHWNSLQPMIIHARLAGTLAATLDHDDWACLYADGVSTVKLRLGFVNAVNQLFDLVPQEWRLDGVT